MTVLVLGDQLTRAVGPVAARPDDRVLMIEAREFARRLPYHPHKLTLVFGAMRAYRDALRDAGREVEYVRAATFREGLATHLDRHPDDDLAVMRPSSHGGAERLRRLVEREGGRLDVVDDELFLCSRATFAEFADGRTRPYRHEEFYRFMRRKTGYLMADGEPVGGEWNYDDRNREFPDESYDPPEPP
jgi:deoxyribodipyrimidine photolyase-related protein